MPTVRVEVTQEVEVTIDEDKYTEEDLEAFREDFYNFADYEDHAQHLAQLKAQGLITDRSDDFVEGYGPLDEAGIQVSKIHPPRVETDPLSEQTMRSAG